MKLTLLAAALSIVSFQMASAQASVDAAALERGTTNERYEALGQILKVSPVDRDSATWLAISNEVMRLSEIFRRAAETSEPLAENYGPYYENLVGAISQWTDTCAIPPLVSAIGSGGLAQEALARFGDASVDVVIDIVTKGEDMSAVSGAAFTLAKMIRPNGNASAPLVSPANQRKIVMIVHDLLTVRLRWYNAISITSLALATGDEAVRARIEGLASDGTAWPVDPAQPMLGGNRRVALSRHC